MTATQAQVYWTLSAYGPLTGSQIVALSNLKRGTATARLSELVKAGTIIDTGERIRHEGKRCFETVWAVAPPKPVEPPVALITEAPAVRKVGFWTTVRRWLDSLGQRRRTA